MSFVIQWKTILDLGCGSIACHDNSYGFYEPWMARFLHNAGYKIIGVDVDKAVLHEPFPAHHLDLFIPDSLSFLPDNSIDIAHAGSLFDSLYMREKYGSVEQEFKQRLLKQLSRVVKLEGFF